MTGLGPSPQILRKQTPKVLADTGVKTDGIDRWSLTLSQCNKQPGFFKAPKKLGDLAKIAKLQSGGASIPVLDSHLAMFINLFLTSGASAVSPKD